MKRLVLISSYCDTEEKINILKENLIEYKKLGLDTLLISPIDLGKEIFELCDYYFNTKENPLISYPEWIFFWWRITELNNIGTVKLQRGYPDYGWAALLQTKRLLQLGIILEYDILIHTIYDLDLNEETKEKILHEGRNMIFKRRELPNNIVETSLHLIILNKETANNFQNEITYSMYHQIGSNVENFIANLKIKFEIESSDIVVEDRINFYQNWNHFDLSINNKYKIFFSKNLHINRNFDIVIYDIKEFINFEILINEKKWTYSTNENFILNTGILCKDISSFKIKIDNSEDDYLDNLSILEWSAIETL